MKIVFTKEGLNMKVAFFFDATGMDGSQYASDKEKLGFNNNVLRVYIKGCQDKNVGNGAYFPDLEIVANKIQASFEGKQLSLIKLRTNLGEGLASIDHDPALQPPVEVEEILLEGLSRGAVTTYAVAKKLDECNIPMHIIANQPVSGEVGPFKRLFKKYSDLRHCKNIRSATTILASHLATGSGSSSSIFTQMVASFSSNTIVSNFLVPHQTHFDWLRNGSPVSYHLAKVCAKLGYIKAHHESFTKKIHTWYSFPDGYNQPCTPDGVLIADPNVDREDRNFRDHIGYCFTPPELLQTIYGAENPISKDPEYLSWLKAEAQSIIGSQRELTDAQAAAIVAISKVNLDNTIHPAFIDFILSNTINSGQLVRIVNKVSEICAFLPYMVGREIKEHTAAYEKTLYEQSFHFLQKAQPSVADKKEFAKNIHQTEVLFRDNALSTSTELLRKSLKIITNFITHVTGVGLICNAIHKYNTGNWWFFTHNDEVNLVRNNRRALMHEIDNRTEQLHP